MKGRRWARDGRGGQKRSSEGTHEILSVAQRTKSVLGINVLINSSYLKGAQKEGANAGLL